MSANGGNTPALRIVTQRDRRGRSLYAVARGETIAAEIEGSGPVAAEEAALIVRAVNSHEALVSALRDAAEMLDAAAIEFYQSAHSSGDPADESNMQSDALSYRECRAAATAARAALAAAEGGAK